jgi:hypothetical protein
MLTLTEFGPASVMVTVPTDPEIPRLFELRLNEIEFADAIGVMARAAAKHKTGITIFRAEILTARVSRNDEVYSKIRIARQGPHCGLVA